jgi:hypothetical protein
MRSRTFAGKNKDHLCSFVTFSAGGAGLPHHTKSLGEDTQDDRLPETAVEDTACDQ